MMAIGCFRKKHSVRLIRLFCISFCRSLLVPLYQQSSAAYAISFHSLYPFTTVVALNAMEEN